MGRPHPNRFIALLRGINIGGHHIILKDDLRACFCDIGATSVKTYIQSGNVVFRSGESSVTRLTDSITQALSQRFDYHGQTVVIPYRKYISSVSSAPLSWGDTDHQRHHAVFTLSPTNPQRVINQLPVHDPRRERIEAAPGVIFWSIDDSFLARSAFAKLPQLPVYKHVTVRNHNTVLRLRKMIEEI